MKETNLAIQTNIKILVSLLNSKAEIDQVYILELLKKLVLKLMFAIYDDPQEGQIII